MSYDVDMVGRFVDSQRYDGNSQTNKYTERDLSFDRNGNILTLKRYGTNVAAPQDNLAYTYDGNKLMQLNGATYQYDSNGNMTHDGRRGLDLSWNHLNLPATISNDEDEDATVNYTYLADGTKVITQQPAAGEGYAYLGSETYKLVNNVWTLESVPFTGGRFIANSTGGMDEYRYIKKEVKKASSNAIRKSNISKYRPRSTKRAKAAEDAQSALQAAREKEAAGEIITKTAPVADPLTKKTIENERDKKKHSKEK